MEQLIMGYSEVLKCHLNLYLKARNSLRKWRGDLSNGGVLASATLGLRLIWEAGRSF